MVATRKPKVGVRSLSKRQLRILTLTVRGWTNTQIAELLGISPSAINAHRSNLYGKLQLQNKNELTAWYWRLFHP